MKWNYCWNHYMKDWKCNLKGFVRCLSAPDPQPQPPEPPYLVDVEVCTETEMMPSLEDVCSTKIKQYPPNEVPVQICPHHRVRVCEFSQNLLNQYCPGTVEIIALQDPTEICSIHKPPQPVVVCKHPLTEGWPAIIWSGLRLCEIPLEESGGFHESDLPLYYDALATDNINATRSVAVFLDDNALWHGKRPWLGDDLSTINDAYYAQFDRRVSLAVERKITYIVTIGPYAGYHLRGDPNFMAYARNFVQRTKKHLPFIRYETWNEPGDGQESEPDKVYWSKMLVDMLQEEGIPDCNIMIPYADCSDFAALLRLQMKGQGLGSLHWVGSMETIQQDEHPWEGSPGTMMLMAHGLIASNDGQDKQRRSLGLNFYELQQIGNTEYTRPNTPQLFDITRWMTRTREWKNEDTGQTLPFKCRGYEHLSAACSQHSELPNIQDAITLGAEERRAMSTGAYQDD